MSRKIGSTALAAMLLVTTVVTAMGVGAAAAASTETTIDAEHPLAESSAVATYEDEGYVEANLSRVELRLAVADSATSIDGYDPVTEDLGSQYYVIDYDGGINRDLRVHFPSEYAHPVAKDAQCRGNPGVTATLTPVRGSNYTSVELSADGPTRCIIELHTYRTTTHGLIERVDERIEEVAGVGIPGVGGGYEWQYRSATAFGSNSVLRIDGVQVGDAVVQYRTADGEWIPVPDDGDPVHTMTKEGDKDTIWVVSTTDSPPRIRYKPSGMGAGGILSDIASIPERIGDDLGIPDIIPDIDIPFIGGDSGDDESTSNTTSTG